jgi:hypothetical protein
MPPAMKSNCVERFNVSFLDEPPLVIGSAIVLLSLLGALRRPGRDFKNTEASWGLKRFGSAGHMVSLFRCFASHEYLLLSLFVTWIGLEVIDLLVVKSGYFTAPNFLNLLFHVVLGPALLLTINYHALILSPFRKLTKIHTLANRFILLAMALDISLLYIKLYIGRNFSCSQSAFSLGRVMLMQISVAVTGVCTVALLKKYVDLFVYPTRPCMTTGSRTKFLIIENVVTYSEPPTRRRDALSLPNLVGVGHPAALHSTASSDLVVEDIESVESGNRKGLSQLVTVTVTDTPGKGGVVVMTSPTAMRRAHISSPKRDVTKSDKLRRRPISNAHDDDSDDQRSLSRSKSESKMGSTTIGGHEIAPLPPLRVLA